MIEVKVEDGLEVLYELVELARQHYEEVESKVASIPFNPDKAQFEALHSLGMLKAVVARDNGVAVGYFIVGIFPDILTSKKMCKEVGIFVSPEYRGTSVFFRMLKEVEKLSGSMGAYAVYLTFKAGHDKGFAERLGYELTETSYQKLLEK